MTSAPTNSSAKGLWAALTPSSKKKATSALNTKNLPGSVKREIWKDLGLNVAEIYQVIYKIKQI